MVAIDQFGSEDVKQSVSKWIVCIPNGVCACMCVCTAGALRVLSWNYTLQSKTVQIDISSHTATIKRIGDCSDRFFLAFEFWEALDSNIYTETIQRKVITLQSLYKKVRKPWKKINGTCTRATYSRLKVHTHRKKIVRLNFFNYWKSRSIVSSTNNFM